MRDLGAVRSPHMRAKKPGNQAVLKMRGFLRLRAAFSRQGFSQLLLIEGESPAAAIRLEHEDVAAIRQWARQRTRPSLLRPQY